MSATRHCQQSLPSARSSSSSKASWAAKKSPALKTRTAAPKPGESGREARPRLLGGRPGNHGGCGERSGGCERRARSFLLRRAFRHASSVVAELAALAPRLVRLARHDYLDGLLAANGRARASAGRSDLVAGPPRGRRQAAFLLPWLSIWIATLREAKPGGSGAVA